MSDDEPMPLGKLAALPLPGATVGRFEVNEGDLVRCGLAPYLFRVRRDGGGALLLEPVGAAEAAALAAAGALADEHQAQAEAAHEPGEPDDGDQGSGHGSLPGGPGEGARVSWPEDRPAAAGAQGHWRRWGRCRGKKREDDGGASPP
jgi:hypothetical protein